MIDINQIRELLSSLQKSSFNNKPKFILIDNTEFLNVNSINALLKVIEEPSINIHFILIKNNESKAKNGKIIKICSNKRPGAITLSSGIFNISSWCPSTIILNPRKIPGAIIAIYLL